MKEHSEKLTELEANILRCLNVKMLFKLYGHQSDQHGNIPAYRKFQYLIKQGKSLSSALAQTL